MLAAQNAHVHLEPGQEVDLNAPVLQRRLQEAFEMAVDMPAPERMLLSLIRMLLPSVDGRASAVNVTVGRPPSPDFGRALGLIAAAITIVSAVDGGGSLADQLRAGVEAGGLRSFRFLGPG